MGAVYVFYFYCSNFPLYFCKFISNVAEEFSGSIEEIFLILFIALEMLIFFSFGVGLIFKEWNKCARRTIGVLLIGLLVLTVSFGLITYGSYVGEAAVAKNAATPTELS